MNIQFQKIKRIIIPLFVFCIFVILFFTNGVPGIQSDGFGSYHITNCLINENSFTCHNKPEYYPIHSHHTVSFYNEKYVTVYAPGAALINLPGQFVANILSKNQTIYNNHFKATNGHSLESGIFFLLTASVVSLISLILIYKSLRNFGFSKKISFWSTVLTYLSSYAIWYVLLNSGFNHTYEILGLSILMFGLSRIEDSNWKKFAIYTAIGIGIATLCRPPLVITAIIPILYLLYKKDFRKLSYIVATGIPFALIFLQYNATSYGSFLKSSYSILFNQDFEYSSWHGLDVLLSSYRGWFVYSPIFILSIIGLILGLKRRVTTLRRYTIFSLIIPILFTIFIYGFWPMWWGGGSYGQRFLISFLPFCAFGLAIFLRYILNTKFRKVLLVVIAFFTIWTLTLTFFYRFTPVPNLRPIDDQSGIMTSGDRYTPIDIFNYQIDLVKNSNGIRDYASRFAKSMFGGDSFIPLILGLSDDVLIFKQSESVKDAFTINFVKNPKSNKTENDLIEFYIKSELEIYKSSFKANDLIDKEIQIQCENKCSSNISGQGFRKENTEVVLNKNEYIGLEINNSLSIYLKKVPNFLYKGILLKSFNTNFYNL